MTPPRARILFVEDDVNLGFVIRDTLENVPFTVIHCTTGPDAWATFRTGAFDLCLFDVMLDSRYGVVGQAGSEQDALTDGFALARQIRAVNAGIPILFLSALADKDDRLRGLRLGADDYLTKPFSIEELILKINVFLKRSAGPATDPTPPSNTAGPTDSLVSAAPALLNRQNLTLHLDNGVQTLTHREADVLAYLLDHPGTLVRRDELLRAIWGDDDYFMGRSLDVFISRLRKRLANDPTVRIENVHGVGFLLRRQ